MQTMLVPQIKTWVFMASYTLTLLITGQLLGGRQGLLLAFVLTLGLNFVSYFYSDEWILWTYSAQRVEGADSNGLNKLVRQIADIAGIKPPKVYMIPSETPNAFSIGRSSASASIAVTEGLIKTLNRGELEAIIAHEVGHIVNSDTFTMMVTATLASIVLAISDFFWWMVTLGQTKSKIRDRATAVQGILLAFIAPWAAMIIHLTARRKREYKADQVAVELTGKASQLASALWKIQNYAVSLPMPATQATAHLFTVNPLENKGWNRLFVTHPPVQARIQKLIGRTL